MNISEVFNTETLENNFRKYRQDPESVSLQWRRFFQGMEFGATKSRLDSDDQAQSDHVLKQVKVAVLIRRFRRLGHLLACLDPLAPCPAEHPLLDYKQLGLEESDLEREFLSPEFAFMPRARLDKILELLKQTYCRSIGVEFMHIQDPVQRKWLLEQMEPVANRPRLDADTRLRLLEKLVQAAVFEQFLNRKYLAVTRFSLEGAEGLLVLLDMLLERFGHSGGREVVLAMAHRGRLNVQANILGRPVQEIIAEFESCYDPDQLVGAGDVKYHNGYLGRVRTASGNSLLALLVNNPSHLEAVDPVAEGLARARQELEGDRAGAKVLPLLIHGDAAFAGQGIVAETLNMSQLEGYTTAGTVHLVINNQIGYTTVPADARSTRYSTDIAKMLEVPIFHVHGEDPEALAHVARLAIDYRQRFGQDVVIDMVCYRRYGHNEGDEPYFTQPLMYDRIRRRPPVYKLYSQVLEKEGVASKAKVAQMGTALQQALEEAYNRLHGSACLFPQDQFYPQWEGYSGKYSHAAVATAVEARILTDLCRRLTRVPAGFHPHPKVEALLTRRLEAVEKGRGIDWANAEALAFASLLAEGVPVRLSGQDSGRGTFSQRHSVLFDRQTGRPYVPLANLEPGQAPFAVYNSHLSEAGVLGFEYGYSLARPEALVIWEAQFGDFANNAQAIIDLFIVAGQAKWQRLSHLVMLLPHGWEGLGPEHSSARLERFLQLCAEDNIQVCNPTTPAQYFHLLRRQIKALWRKPLVIMAPKSLLRHKAAVSSLEELSQGSFSPLLDDPQPPEKGEILLLCSGKIYYQLEAARRSKRAGKVALVRLEQLYPFPRSDLEQVLAPYRQRAKVVWVQEEPANMGPWSFVRPRLEQILGRPVQYAGRPPAASPATGFPHIYRRQQEQVVRQAFERN